MQADILQRAGPAATLAARVKLGDEARALLRPEWSAQQYLGALIATGHLPDAIRFLAWALPRREAVWWACRCIHAAKLPEGPPEDAAALAAQLPGSRCRATAATRTPPNHLTVRPGHRAYVRPPMRYRAVPCHDFGLPPTLALLCAEVAPRPAAA